MDWYKRGETWSQRLMPVDSVSSDLLQLDHDQPIADVGSLCTVMLPLSPFGSLNWAKIPCEYPIFRAGAICKQHATGKLDLHREGHNEMMAGVCVCPSVRPSVACFDLTRQRKGLGTRKPKIGTMKAHHTSNLWTYLEVKRSTVKVTRPINVVTDNATLLRSAGIPATQRWKWKRIPLNK